MGDELGGDVVSDQGLEVWTDAAESAGEISGDLLSESDLFDDSLAESFDLGCIFFRDVLAH